MKETTPAAMPPSFDRWCKRFDDVWTHQAQKREFRNYIGARRRCGDCFSSKVSGLTAHCTGRKGDRSVSGSELSPPVSLTVRASCDRHLLVGQVKARNPLRYRWRAAAKQIAQSHIQRLPLNCIAIDTVHLPLP